MTVVFDPDMIRTVLKMRLVERKSMKATAKRVGVDVTTLLKFCRERGLPSRVRGKVEADDRTRAAAAAMRPSSLQPNKEQSHGVV